MLAYFIGFIVIGFILGLFIKDVEKVGPIIFVISILWGLASGPIWGFAAFGELSLGFYFFTRLIYINQSTIFTSKSTFDSATFSDKPTFKESSALGYSLSANNRDGRRIMSAVATGGEPLVYDTLNAAEKVIVDQNQQLNVDMGMTIADAKADALKSSRNAIDKLRNT